jgi:hypothetical protein
MPIRVETHHPGLPKERSKKRQDKASKRFYNSYAWISPALSSSGSTLYVRCAAMLRVSKYKRISDTTY